MSNIILSQYSNMPRVYTINGKRYDIDDIYDITQIPIFSAHIHYNGVEYGMDTILVEHAHQAIQKNKSIYYAAIEKANEFRKHGIVNMSEREIAARERYRLSEDRRIAVELERRRRHDAFTIEDMQRFTCIPFEWSFITELNHTDGVAWFMLNMNNQQVARFYISLLNEIILDAHDYIDGISNLWINIDDIDYGYPKVMHPKSMANTRVECCPYSKTGKVSKYPAVLVSVTQTDNYFIRIEAKIMVDGSIGAAEVSFAMKERCVIFHFGLYGISLIIKKVELYQDGKKKIIFRYSDII